MPQEERWLNTIKAIADFNQAIELDSNYTRAYATRGLTYTAIGEFELAIKDYNQALELRPNYAWAYANLYLCTFW